MVKIWNTTAKAYGNQLVRPSWDIVNPGLDKPRKEVVVPKEIKHPRRTGRSCRPAGPLPRMDMANRGFLSY